MKRVKVTIRLVKHATNIFLKCYIFFCEQATKSDRIYVNSPEAQAGDNGNIAILSFKQSSKLEEEGGIHNKGMTKQDEADDEEDENEETLTPGDLMAFAWQISEGMVRLLLCCVTIFLL